MAAKSEEKVFKYFSSIKEREKIHLKLSKNDNGFHK